MISLAAVAGERRDNKGKQNLRKTSTSGDAVVFDVNKISTYIRNNGSFNRNPGTGNAGFEWPKGTGNTANYASGIWLGGLVGTDPRVAIAEYAYEFDAGPIAPGVNPEDPRWRVYKIKRGDNALTNPDYANWPFDDGAPAVQSVTGTGDSLDASGNRIPLIVGDMTVWAVFNDNDLDYHVNMHTSPLGIEVQLTAFGFNRADALGNTVFYKWKLINKGGNTIDNAFVTVWTDVDLGDSGDDYDGCDTTLGLGYTYNADPTDGVYGSTVPATGFDFLQGPLVPSPGDTARFPDGRIVPDKKFLKMTSFVKYNNDQSDLGNPNTGQEVLNYMQGLTRSGLQITDDVGRPTPFMFPGDPNLPYDANTNWIESGAGGDRRFMMSAGPFTMAPGDTQEIVAGNLIAQGADYHNSVTVLKRADDLVQLAYDINFALAPPPPNPAVDAVGLSNEIVLSWGKDYSLADQIENYTVGDPIAGKTEEIADTVYEFEAYSVYQFANSSGDDPRLVATFDRTDSDAPLEIIDQFSDPRLGTVTGVVKSARNSGLSRTIRLTQDKYTNGPFSNNKDYYFAVTAWAYNDSSIPKVIESPFNIITIRPGKAPGSRSQVAFGDTITSQHVGPGDGDLLGLVVNPRAITGDQYKVTFATDTATGDVVWNVDNTTTAQRVVSNQTNQDGGGEYPIIDGIMFQVLGPAKDVKDFMEVANAAGPHAPTQGTFLFNGSGFPSTMCPTLEAPCDRPTANVGGGRWGIHTGAAGILDDFSYELFRSRVFRGESNFERFIPYDFEIRFTPAGGKAFLAFTSGSIIDVPFELWNIGIGTPNDPSDDYRLIPWINDANADEAFGLDGDDHPISGGDNDPETDWIYWYIPTNKSPGDVGYQTEFIAAGAGYDGTDGAGNDHEEAMARMVLVNWNGGSVSDPTYPANINQQIPEVGSVFRIVSTKPSQAGVDEFTLSTAAYKDSVGQGLAQDDINLINAVPNPYFGTSAYERNQFNRIIRFTNLPQKAKVRIFNLAADLVKVLDKDDVNTSIDWDLTNRNDIPVASGMYIVHIEVPGVGERILKVAVVMPEERLDNF